MNKADLVDLVAADVGITKKDTEAVINSMMAAIIKEVAGDGHVTLVGFGTFEARNRKEREGRNPRTNAPLVIAAKRVAAFKSGKEFAEAVDKKRK